MTRIFLQVEVQMPKNIFLAFIFKLTGQISDQNSPLGIFENLNLNSGKIKITNNRLHKDEPNLALQKGFNVEFNPRI